MAVPVDRIPTELLAEVFTVLACGARQAPSPMSWIHILLVCRHWNDVTRATSALWRAIYVNSSLDWLRLCLHRCSRASLDLHIAGVRLGTVDTALTLAAHHPPGVRALLIPGYKRRTSALHTLFATSKLKPLEELVIRPADSTAADEEPTYALSAARHSHLRVLELAGVAVPRDPAFLAYLRVLTLNDHCCIHHAFTMPDLLDAFAAASGTLEELDLVRFSPHISSPAAAAAAQAAALEQRPLIYLARLHSLHAHPSSTVLMPLLRALRFPGHAVVDVRTAIDPIDAARLGTQLLPTFVPPDVRDTLESADALLIAFSHHGLSLTVPALAGVGEESPAVQAQFTLTLHQKKSRRPVAPQGRVYRVR